METVEDGCLTINKFSGIPKYLQKIVDIHNKYFAKQHSKLFLSEAFDEEIDIITDTNLAPGIYYYELVSHNSPFRPNIQLGPKIEIPGLTYLRIFRILGNLDNRIILPTMDISEFGKIKYPDNYFPYTHQLYGKDFFSNEDEIPVVDWNPQRMEELYVLEYIVSNSENSIKMDVKRY